MPPAPPPTPSAGTMRAALTTLFDGMAGSRQVFRHLAAVEHDLTRKDAAGRFLFDVPADRLKIVQRQLDGLIGAATPSAGLVQLRACLADAIKSRLRHELREDLRQPISAFTDEKLQVTEVRHSEFDAIHAAWNASAAPNKTPDASS